jgi:hypothetical protein
MARKVFGALRLAGGIAIFVTLAFQIQDEVAHNALIPGHYFAYFTIQSSMINVVVLLAGGAYALSHARDTVVLSTLLRNLPPTGYVGIQWPNEVLHVWIPIFLFLDWIFGPGRARLPFRSLWVVVSYPLAWAAFTLVRGPFYGWYPYPFIDPANGIQSLVAYIAGLAVFFVILGSLATLRTRLAISGRQLPA